MEDNRRDPGSSESGAEHQKSSDHSPKRILVGPSDSKSTHEERNNSDKEVEELQAAAKGTKRNLNESEAAVNIEPKPGMGDPCYGDPLDNLGDLKKVIYGEHAAEIGDAKSSDVAAMDEKSVPVDVSDVCELKQVREKFLGTGHVVRVQGLHEILYGDNNNTKYDDQEGKDEGSGN